jgi:hypothetical protein
MTPRDAVRDALDGDDLASMFDAQDALDGSDNHSRR